VKSPTTSSDNVTRNYRYGMTQRFIIALIGHEGELTFSQLSISTELGDWQLGRALRALIAAGAIVHVWNKKGLAVYRLKEKNDVCKD
jgi:hypothetical protein